MNTQDELFDLKCVTIEGKLQELQRIANDFGMSFGYYYHPEDEESPWGIAVSFNEGAPENHWIGSSVSMIENTIDSVSHTIYNKALELTEPYG